MSQLVSLALSTDFFKSFSELSQTIQSKVSKFIMNFQRDPKSSGINYEKINDAADKNMRSVRIDDNYRGIVLKPENGNVFMLLWIDTHDNAYKWAQRHKCSINQHTGAIQIYDVVQAGIPKNENYSNSVSQNMLFADISDKELMMVGVPEEQIPVVRKVRTEEDVDNIEKLVPSEAYEALFMIAAGDSVQQILNERESDFSKIYDTEDFDAALKRVESLSRFVVAENETELATALNNSLKLWRIFLHPSQLRLAKGNKSGAVRVLGGAGTGKTVVAMHRAKWLAENYLKNDEKILFTTFTKNLAIDIKNNLKELCSPEVFDKIDVINIDAWVAKYLKSKKYEYKIIMKTNEEFWKIAMTCKPQECTLPDSFFKEEWQRIIQTQGIENIEQYKLASRIGRGTTIGRSDRFKIWPVFEEYRNQLLRNKEKEINDAYRDCAALIKYDLNNSRKLPYKAVIVDEAQDMGTPAFVLLRALVEKGSNDMFIVGDGHQRIYGRNKVVLTKCGIDIRGRSKKLKINYRTTEEIRNAAVALLEGVAVDDLDGESDNQRLYKSLTHGEKPLFKHFDSFKEQVEFIAEYVTNEIKQGTTPSHICITARTNHEIDLIAEHISKAEIKNVKIDINEADLAPSDAIRTATLHRVKGLEFDVVVIASANKGLIRVGKNDESADMVEKLQIENEEKSLLYVGMTRGKKKALVTSYGDSIFISGLVKAGFILP